MQEDISRIIEKARELSDSIRSHAITRSYDEIREKMRSDRNAQELYAKLVMMGKEISMLLAREEKIEAKDSSEYELLREELDHNPLVKEYIQTQREYLDLLKKVIERIENPL
ncbi:MAG: hypothetical protein A2W19_05010 [Spirochaetes bacterium RBG_16_49_21]|nr:MAG: hypothetical protein A2W19_05010 [Spirochaetes bacterium RBG_16_49_21]